MSLLTKIWARTRPAIGHLWSGILDIGWSVWNEVGDGAQRFSWWVLLGLVKLAGLTLGWWLWAH